MTSGRPSGIVGRLDLRDATSEEAGKRVREFLDDAPSALVGLLVVDTVAGLLEHAETFEQLIGSPLIDALMVVAVGPLDRDRSLRVPASLTEGERQVAVLWVGDPVGVVWRPGSRSVTRPEDRAAQPALDRLLAVAQTPAIFQAVCRLPAPKVCAPGLSVLGESTDRRELHRALLAALERVDAGGSGPADSASGSEAIQALRGAVEAPMSTQVVQDGGMLARAGEAVVYAAEDAQSVRTRLTTPWALVTASRHVDAFREAVARTGHALAGYRHAARQLRDEVQTPGGGYERDLVALKCQEFGLTLPASPGGSPRSLGPLLRDVVTDWLRDEESLAAVDVRLQALQWHFSPSTYGTYRQAIDGAIPDEVLDALDAPPSPPAPPAWLPAVAFASGVLVAAPSTALPYVAVVAALVWAGLLLCWPAPGARRARAAAVAALATAAGAVLGAVAGAPLDVPLAISLLVIAAGLVAALVVPPSAWQRSSARWMAEVPLADAVRRQAAAADVVTGMVRAEWSALDVRQSVVDSLIVTRGIVSAARTVLGQVARELRTREISDPQPGRAHPRDPSGEYWSAVAEAQARAFLLAAFEQQWDQVAGSRPQDLQESVAAAVRRRFGPWVSLDPVQALHDDGDLDGLSGPGPSVFGSDTLAAVVAAANLDPDQPSWQLTGPDDVVLLSHQPQDIGTVRFAPSVLPDAARAQLPSSTVLAGMSMAGVLRLVGLREGIVRPTWSTVVLPEVGDRDADGVPGGGLS